MSKKKQLWICELVTEYGELKEEWSELNPLTKFPFTIEELEFLKESFECNGGDDYFYDILHGEFEYPLTALLEDMDKKHREEAQRRTNLLGEKLEKLIEELKK